MKNPQKIEWLKEQLCRADTAHRLLASAKKQRVAEYAERLRKIRDFEDALFVKRTDEQQQELFSPGEILSPELDELLSNPLRGLD